MQENECETFYNNNYGSPDFFPLMRGSPEKACMPESDRLRFESRLHCLLAV